MGSQDTTCITGDKSGYYMYHGWEVRILLVSWVGSQDTTCIMVVSQDTTCIMGGMSGYSCITGGMSGYYGGKSGYYMYHGLYVRILHVQCRSRAT